MCLEALEGWVKEYVWVTLLLTARGTPLGNNSIT
jgi:hypothetical protein